MLHCREALFILKIIIILAIFEVAVASGAREFHGEDGGIVIISKKK
jgi:hypothetical protein